MEVALDEEKARARCAAAEFDVERRKFEAAKEEALPLSPKFMLADLRNAKRKDEGVTVAVEAATAALRAEKDDEASRAARAEAELALALDELCEADASLGGGGAERGPRQRSPGEGARAARERMAAARHSRERMAAAKHFQAGYSKGAMMSAYEWTIEAEAAIPTWESEAAHVTGVRVGPSPRHAHPAMHTLRTPRSPRTPRRAHAVAHATPIHDAPHHSYHLPPPASLALSPPRTPPALVRSSPLTTVASPVLPAHPPASARARQVSTGCSSGEDSSPMRGRSSRDRSSSRGGRSRSGSRTRGGSAHSSPRRPASGTGAARSLDFRSPSAWGLGSGVASGTGAARSLDFRSPSRAHEGTPTSGVAHDGTPTSGVDSGLDTPAGHSGAATPKAKQRGRSLFSTSGGLVTPQSTPSRQKSRLALSVSSLKSAVLSGGRSSRSSRKERSQG